ncbi:MAG: InlB B-repeat-containing protein [Planctomycetota bacterium]|jgi:hypothetical protein
MKRGHPRFIACKGIILGVAIIVGGLLAPAYCQTSSVTLLLQQTPTKGGIITPTTGIYHYAPDSEVTLTAVPKDGFQFTYWLGDVSNPTSSFTVVHLDEPKVIVAVFEPTNYDTDTLDMSGSLPASGGGGGGLFASAPDFRRPSAITAGGGAGKLQGPISWQIGDGVAETPEPATGVLLVLGSLFAFARRGTKKQTR